MLPFLQNIVTKKEIILKYVMDKILGVQLQYSYLCIYGGKCDRDNELRLNSIDQGKPRVIKSASFVMNKKFYVTTAQTI